jgi:hypothetical protein
MDGDYHGQRRTTWFLWKEFLKPSDIHCWLSAVCGEKHVLAALFSTGYGFDSGKETARVAVQGRYRNSPKEWFRVAIWKLPRR